MQDHASLFSSPPDLLHLQNVSVRRGNRLVLDSLNLKVARGERVAILGPNGCGKSTLLKLLQRELYPLLHPGTSLQILGKENWNIFELRSELGIVSNDLMLQCSRDITGRELVLSGFFGSVGIWPNQVVTAEQERIAEQAMERLGISALRNRWTDELSSGEARRVLIARALIHNPGTLVLDEPTTSLDLAAQRLLREHMRSLAASGIGLLLVTHHLEEIIPEIDRVVLLQNGRLLDQGTPGELVTDEKISQLFGTQVQVRHEDGTYRAW